MGDLTCLALVDCVFMQACKSATPITDGFATFFVVLSVTLTTLSTDPQEDKNLKSSVVVVVVTSLMMEWGWVDRARTMAVLERTTGLGKPTQ